MRRQVAGRDAEVARRASATLSTEQVQPRGVDIGEPPAGTPTTVNRMTKEEHLAELKRLLNESAALETMLQDTVAGRRPPASDVPGSLQPGHEAPGRSRRRLRLVIGAVVIAALVAADAVALVQVNNRSPRTVRVVTASSPAHVLAAASWAARELSHDAKIVADPVMRAALAADRFTHVQTPAAARSGTALTFDYIVSTATLRATASAGNPVDRALNASLPIAVFGSGRDQIVVRQVSTVSAADIAARRSTDRQIRRTAEQQLLANPAVRARGAARAALQAGRLDLRAATVLALLANSGHIDILSVNVDEPERAAGLPARSIDVRADAVANGPAVFSNLPRLYEPIADTQSPDGTHRMVWSIDPEPPPALN